MIEAMKQALEALEDFVDVIKYDNEQDDIGRRACCDVLSYNPHSESCKAKQAITAIKEAIRERALYEVQRFGQEIEQEQPLPPVEIGVDVTTDGASVVAFYRRPNAVMEMFYSQFHPAPQHTEQNFCPRCGKRTNDIHTCTPPQENT
jgi:hypothetical protein